MTHNGTVKCECGFTVLEDNILKSRLVRFEADAAYAKCKRCKREIEVPLARTAKLLKKDSHRG